VKPLGEWETFYVIVGSSAGALIGLQFVVMALVADLPIRRKSAQSTDAFGTPTVVHFGAVLLLSAMFTAPWRSIGPPSVLFGTGGAVGIVYVAIVARRARRQTTYEPVFEDWLFHVLLPAVAYVTLAAAAYAVRSHAYEALFAVGSAALLLLFIGIHNSWDTVTYLVLQHRPEPADRSNRPNPGPPL